MLNYKDVQKEIDEEEEILFKMIFNVMHRNPVTDKDKNELDFLKEKFLPPHILS